MKALLLSQKTYDFEVKDIEKPKVSKSEVLIKLNAAAINHHELWTLKEKNLKSDAPILLGSDGAGIIEDVGTEVERLKPGDEVVINPSLNWGEKDRIQSRQYEILGFPTRGTFAEYILIGAQYVYPKPEHLSFEEAAALPLAGLTAYRALFTRGEFEPDSKILITGIGGGAALFAMNFAIASDAEVYVTSSDETKMSKAIELGAKGAVNYKNNDWSTELKKMAGGFDIIIDSAAGPGFSSLVDLAHPGGRIALFGRTAGNISSLNPRAIFWKQLSIHGTTMGNDQEFKAMMEFISNKNIRPVIDSVFPPKDINLAFEKMDQGKQFGKIVMDLNNFSSSFQK
ncbi:MAG: zinc-binding dehydrogenase [Bacteroidales bacterium]|nr:zinc-binding dehydrogenase [Bacteroidales bacterium]